MYYTIPYTYILHKISVYANFYMINLCICLIHIILKIKKNNRNENIDFKNTI